MCVSFLNSKDNRVIMEIMKMKTSSLAKHTHTMDIAFFTFTLYSFFSLNLKQIDFIFLKQF